MKFPIELSEKELRLTGEKLHAAGMSWHLHVLSPGCKLNIRKAHAIVVEDTHAGVQYITYSPHPMPETAHALATLVHGKTATVAPPGDEPEPICPVVRQMVVRAKELMAAGRHWHHHIFFPQCVFNPLPGQWTIIFEDPDCEDVLTSVTNEQPVHDIGVTERLYYAQVRRRVD